MGRYKQTLLREGAYNQLVAAKEILHRTYGKRITISDVIDLLVGRKLGLLYLPREMQDYVAGFTKIAASDASVVGVLLFGSVARGTYDKHSDIDILVLVKGRGVDHTHDVHAMVQAANPLSDALAGRGIYSYITPLVIGTEDIRSFSPLYISFVEDGIALFDRDGMLGGFLARVARMQYSREEMAGTAVIRWSNEGR